MKDYTLTDIIEIGRDTLEAAYGRWERWTQDGGYTTPDAWATKLIESLYPELATPGDLPAATRFAFEDEVVMQTPAAEALAHEQGRSILCAFVELLTPMQRTEPALVKTLFKTLRDIGRERYGLRGRDVMFQVRAALTGAVAGPCLEVVVCLLGRQRCLDRARKWIACDNKETTSVVSAGSRRESDTIGRGEEQYGLASI